jgi:hypothetical protein
MPFFNDKEFKPGVTEMLHPAFSLPIFWRKDEKVGAMSKNQV